MNFKMICNFYAKLPLGDGGFYLPFNKKVTHQKYGQDEFRGDSSEWKTDISVQYTNTTEVGKIDW